MDKNINTSQTNFTFPVGYYPFHKDKHINFQLNRRYSLGYWTKVDALQTSQRIQQISEWKPVLIGYTEQMKAENRTLAAAFGYRAAEFFTSEEHAQNHCQIGNL
jgi:hypothetical protein